MTASQAEQAALPLTVQAALSAVMKDVQAVGKESRNQSQGFNFRGVDAVVNAVGPALREHGVIVLPRVVKASYRDFNTAKGALMHEAVLEVAFTFVGPDGSELQASAMGESADSGDKASAKAHSVAFRTVLLQALCIPTDDPDPDHDLYQRAEREMASAPEPVLPDGWVSRSEHERVWADLVARTAAIGDAGVKSNVVAWVKEHKLKPSTCTKALADEWAGRLPGDGTEPF